MDSIFFWKEWARPYRILYYCLLFVFLLLLISYLVTYNLGVTNIISWETSNTIQNLKFILNSFHVGIFQVQVPAYSYLIEQSYIPADLSINFAYTYIYLFLTFSSLAVINTIISTLSRSYFFLGVGGLIVGFILFKFDDLGILGIYKNYVTAALIILIGGLSYYFHAFRPDISFLKRLIIFVILYWVILLICSAFAEEKAPLLSVSTNGILFFGILSLIFIITVSHEIVYGFLFLATYSTSQGSRNTSLHFVLISCLYFLCLFLMYFKNIGLLDLQIFGTDPFLIFPFSVMIGFFGLKEREFTYGNILSFNPYAAFLYIALAIICLATLGYIFITYNDPAIEAMEDFILFAHIGIGVIFFIYILANFIPLFQKNLNVYKVAYKPERFPFYIVRLGGVFIIIAFLTKAGFFQLNQAISGYLNGLGDLRIAQNDKPRAIQYYKLAKEYDFYNHRSNYALAQLYLSEKNNEEAISYLQEGLKRRPSAQGYVKLSEIYLKKDLYFDAIYALRNGTKYFPQNEHIYNNLSLLYNRTALVDSAYIFINSSRQFSNNDEVAQTNYWGFLARNMNLLQLDIDSISKTEKTTDYLPALNNKLALFNVKNKYFEPVLENIFFGDTSLTEEKFALLTNYSLNKRHIDSSFIQLLDHPLNSSDGKNDFSENIALLKAILNYKNGNTKNAFILLNKLKDEGVTNIGYYNLLLGIWSLENKAYRLAVDYYNNALEKGNKEAFLYRALALSESGNKDQALSAWENVIQLKNPATIEMAVAMKGILSEANFSNLFELGDELKYQALRFRFNDFNMEQRDALSQTISDPKWRARARLLEAQKSWENGQFERLPSLLEELKNMKGLGKDLVSEIEILNLKYLIQNYNSKDLEGKLHNSKEYLLKYSDYIFAHLMEKEKKIASADSSYRLAIKRLPFDYEVIRDAVDFYNKVKKEPEAAYNVSLEATQLNPYSSRLLELYILQCLNVNLINYANDGLEKLKEIASNADYNQFKKVFEAEKIKQESLGESWQ